MRILIIEDDPLLGDGLQAGLRHLGFTPDWVKDGVAARNALSTEEYGALVLDLGLTRLSGLDLLRQVLAGGSAVPVLILTATLLESHHRHPREQCRVRPTRNNSQDR